MLRFTSLVPVTAGPSASLSQENIGDLQDDSFDKVPRESCAVSNRFNPFSGLEPSSPCVPWGPVTVCFHIATVPVIPDVWLLNCDIRGSLVTLDVASSLLLWLVLVGQLIGPRLSHQTNLQSEELNVSWVTLMCCWKLKIFTPENQNRTTTLIFNITVKRHGNETHDFGYIYPLEKRKGFSEHKDYIWPAH